MTKTVILEMGDTKTLLHTYSAGKILRLPAETFSYRKFLFSVMRKVVLIIDCFNRPSLWSSQENILILEGESSNIGQHIRASTSKIARSTRSEDHFDPVTLTFEGFSVSYSIGVDPRLFSML